MFGTGWPWKLRLACAGGLALVFMTAWGLSQEPVNLGSDVTWSAPKTISPSKGEESNAPPLVIRPGIGVLGEPVPQSLKIAEPPIPYKNGDAPATTTPAKVAELPPVPITLNDWDLKPTVIPPARNKLSAMIDPEPAPELNEAPPTLPPGTQEPALLPPARNKLSVMIDPEPAPELNKAPPTLPPGTQEPALLPPPVIVDALENILPPKASAPEPEESIASQVKRKIAEHEAKSVVPAVSDVRLLDFYTPPDFSSGVVHGDYQKPAGEKNEPIQQVGCASCGSRLGPHPGHNGQGGRCRGCGSGWDCYPGRRPCPPSNADTHFGQFLCDLRDCICCPDPCYDPQWIPLADAALFVEGARPVTQQGLRFDRGRNVKFPDRAEYFWARADGNGKGPTIPGPLLGELNVHYRDLVIVNEIALGKASIIIETPYRAVSPDLADHGAGWSDIAIGNKTLLFDCELLQVAFMFKTYLPVGNSMKGVGVGHLSLEPSFIFGLKLSEYSYFQAQLSQWIPIAGDLDYAGAVFHSHFSYNHHLFDLMPDVSVVGTVELNTWSFQDGAYTDPFLGAFQRAGGETYVSMGPGFRVFFCDKFDFGMGSSFSLTSDHLARELFRFSGRVRF